MAIAKEAVIKPFKYPPYYKSPKKIRSQVIEIASLFDLDPKPALMLGEEAEQKLPLRREAEGWFAFPSTPALARKFFPEITDPAEQNIRAIQLLFNKLVTERRSKQSDNALQKWCVLDPQLLRLTERTANALKALAETQPGDIFVVPGQFGDRFGNDSVLSARDGMLCGEFGAHTVAAISLALTHATRFEYHGSGVNVPGEEVRLCSEDLFDRAPIVAFYDYGGCEFPDDGIKVSALPIDQRQAASAPLTFFLP